MFLIPFDKEICIGSAKMKVVCVALNFFVFFFSKDGEIALLDSLYC